MRLTSLGDLRKSGVLSRFLSTGHLHFFMFCKACVIDFTGIPDPSDHPLPLVVFHPLCFRNAGAKYITSER